MQLTNEGYAGKYAGIFSQTTIDELCPRLKVLKANISIREGVNKSTFFLGLCPKHRTPPTHRARLGLH